MLVVFVVACVRKRSRRKRVQGITDESFELSDLGSNADRTFKRTSMLACYSHLATSSHLPCLHCPHTNT